MVSVSIVTYKTDLGELVACLNSLTSDRVSKVFIVDNGGEDRIREFVKGFPKTEYVRLSNPGYGTAHNVAINKAMELRAGDAVDYHLVLNSDVKFDPVILGTLEEMMNSRPEVGCVQPMVTYPEGGLQPTARLLPTPLDVFGRRFLPKKIFAKRNARYTLAWADHNKEMNVPYLQGSFMFMRLTALRDVGMFDERFFMYPEDIDLSRRIHRRYKTLYWPEVRVIHAHRAGSYHNIKLLWIHVVNMWRYFCKWGWWVDAERRQFNHRLLNELGNRG